MVSQSIQVETVFDVTAINFTEHLFCSRLSAITTTAVSSTDTSPVSVCVGSAIASSVSSSVCYCDGLCSLLIISANLALLLVLTALSSL
jgi:hypothetical protein